jgi:hypothetical protein
MKGGGVKRATDKRYPAFLGAMLDVLPIMIDMEDENREVTVGVYSSQLPHIIGEGAYDAEGHRNTQFLEATEIGPFPKEMQQAWTRTRQEAAENYGIVDGDGQDEWNKMGPMVEPTPATVKNRGSAERKPRRRVEASTTSPRNQRKTEPTAQPQRTKQREETQREEDVEELMEAVAEALSQAERDEHASQAAREATRGVREDARMMRGQTEIVNGDDENILHEVLVQATERDQETPEDNRKRKGKTPADEESARTLEAVKQR